MTNKKELMEKLKVMLPRTKAGNDMLTAIISMAKQKGKQENEEKLKMDFVLKLMKLPVDKKTNTIKVYDVNKIIDIICNQLEKANPNILETLNILADKQIMKRFKQKSKGKNILLISLKRSLIPTSEDGGIKDGR